jgi:hypothetical protein
LAGFGFEVARDHFALGGPAHFTRYKDEGAGIEGNDDRGAEAAITVVGDAVEGCKGHGWSYINFSSHDQYLRI